MLPLLPVTLEKARSNLARQPVSELLKRIPGINWTAALRLKIVIE